VAEGTGLENRHTGEPGIVSSNLTLSVRPVRRGRKHRRANSIEIARPRAPSTTRISREVGMMGRHLVLLSTVAAAAACAHKPAVQSASSLTDYSARGNCSKASLDSLAPARRDSARIACNGYQFQVGRPPTKP
jgi:hypothetical protein